MSARGHERTGQAATDAFRVDPWSHRLGGLVARHRRAQIRLGDLETRLLADALEPIEIQQPVYIAGLARSGSTVLLEVLSRHPQVGTHRYRDYPMVFTPYAWQRFLDRVPRRRADPVERAHADGIAVTPESPEAFEEMLWMAFFPALHDPRRTSVFDGTAAHPQFEAFYREHVRKLLLARGRVRYASKGNYNLTRMQYLQRLFPDARFVVPVRDPVWHIASLMKQHRLFCEGERAHPEAVTHLQRVGHFEFGLDRRPINASDDETVARVERLWREGAELEGWARYWSHVHGYLADCLEQDPDLRAATRIVRFEELCAQPRRVLGELFAHCGLEPTEAMVEREASAIRFPGYYRPDFGPAEIETIQRLTGTVATRLGVASTDGASAVG